MVKLTEEQAEYFKTIVPGKLWYETSALFKEKYGIEFNRDEIKRLRNRYGLKTNKPGGLYVKGQTSPNKGRTWDEQGIPQEVQDRMRKTAYKKGNMPHNALDKPIGTERLTKEGYIEVKIAERPSKKDCNDNWRAKSKIEYERQYGVKIPKGCCILFADHNPLNFAKDNLVMVERRYLGLLNHKDVEYSDKESLETCIAYIKLQMAINDKLRSERPCQACGKIFKPEYPQQRRCRKCIDDKVPAKKKS